MKRGNGGELDGDDGRGRAARKAGPRKRLWLLVIVVGVMVVGLRCYRWSHPDGAAALSAALEKPIPAGVRGLEASRRYMGGPGDSATFIRFAAGEDVVWEMVEGRDLSDDVLFVEGILADGGSICDVWSGVFGDYAEYGGDEWRCPARCAQPLLCRWTLADGWTTAYLFWCGESGDGYALVLN